MQQSCIDEFDAMSCGGAVLFCESEISAAFMLAGKNVMMLFSTLKFITLSGKNPYDVSKDCTGDELRDTLCYPVMA